MLVVHFLSITSHPQDEAMCPQGDFSFFLKVAFFTLFQKVVLLVAPFFLEVVKIAIFLNHGLDITNIIDKTLKLTLKSKSDSTSSTTLFLELKL
jgi:hypothetical protein